MKASDVVEGRGDKPAAASAGYAKRARRFGRIWLTVTRPFSRSIYVRFQYAFGLAVFGFVLLATITLISSRLLLNFFGETVWEARFEAEPAHYIQAALKETEHLAYAYAVEGDRSASAKFEAVAETVDNRFQKLTEAISLLGSLDHAHSDIAVPEVHKAWLGAQVILRRVFQHGAGSAEAVKALSRAHAAIDPVYDAMSQYHHGSMQNMQERLAAAHSVVQWAYLATMGAIVVGIVVLIGMGIVVGRSILQPIAQLQIAAQRLGKKDFSCRVKLRNTNDELGQLGRAFNTAAAILERLYEELRRRSTHDGLTGVLNRTAFDERLAVECKSADRHGRMTSLLMVDVDHFKRVNDTYGHQIGDRVLIDVVRLLTQLSRPGDIVARYGGEEFVVILPETDEAGAAEMAKRLHGAIRSQVFTAGAGDDIRVTVSIGCACRPPNTVSPEDLVQAADAALLHAKQVGRDGIVSAKGFGAADRPKWGTAAA